MRVEINFFYIICLVDSELKTRFHFYEMGAQKIETIEIKLYIVPFILEHGTILYFSF